MIHRWICLDCAAETRGHRPPLACRRLRQEDLFRARATRRSADGGGDSQAAIDILADAGKPSRDLRHSTVPAIDAAGGFAPAVSRANHFPWRTTGRWEDATGTYTQWSPELDVELARQWLGGLTSREIAAAMGRTTSAVQTHASRMGLPPKLAGPAGKHDGRMVGKVRPDAGCGHACAAAEAFWSEGRHNRMCESCRTESE